MQFGYDLIMSDKTYFYLNGFVKKRNYRFWATENPRISLCFILEVVKKQPPTTLHQPKYLNSLPCTYLGQNQIKLMYTISTFFPIIETAMESGY